MKFSDLRLPEYINRAMESKGISECTEIQAKTIPLLLSGADVIGRSRTGSGKTFAYAVPCVTGIDVESGDTQVMIVCPTRELAAQVTEQIRFLNTYREGCKVVPLFGGINMQRQITSLKKNSEIIVGTPGRIVDHLKRKTLKTDNLKTLVLDEADEMLNMGFRDEMETIIKHCPSSRQTVMFSATMPEAALAISRNYMKNPSVVETDDLTTRSVTQYYVQVGLKNKDAALKSLIKKLKPVHSIVFCNTKRMVDKLSASLTSVGARVSAIHGDMRQSERKAAMDGLKNGSVDMLIATDVAARGIDIDGVDIVFNYDVPQTAEYYTHRIGRTGRADKKGIAFTLINTEWCMTAFERILEQTDNEAGLYELSPSLSPKDKKKESSADEKKKQKERREKKAESEKPYYLKNAGKLKDIREFIDGEKAKKGKSENLRKKGNVRADSKNRHSSKNKNENFKNNKKRKRGLKNG